MKLSGPCLTIFMIGLLTIFFGGCAAKIDWRPFRSQPMVWYQKGTSDTEMRADLEQCKENLLDERGINVCMKAKGYLLIPRDEAELLKVKALQKKGLKNEEIAKRLHLKEKKVSRYASDQYDLGPVENLGQQPVDVLANLGKAGVDPLIAELTNQSPLVRRQAAQALGEIGDPRAVGPLVKTLQDRDALIRRHAVEALGRIGDNRAVPPLLAMLDQRSEPSYVRMAVAEALGRIGDPNAVPSLIQAMKASDWGLRSRAAASLGKIGDPRAIPSLLEALADKDALMRGYAAVALGDIGDSRAIDELRAVVEEDEDKHVRKKAESALVKIETYDSP